MRKIFFIMIFFISLPINCWALCENSQSCILMDTNSGRILYSKRIDSKYLIASTTKLMTFLVAYENGNLDDVYEVGEEVLKMYGTSIYLSLGEKMSLRDLLYGLILRSGNDASVVIANNIGKNYDDFVALMNKRARELGMKNTIFLNPHGLDEETENYSTSRDMAILSSYLSRIPFYREVSATKHYVTSTNLKSYDWYNRNKLLTQYQYATGGKNGYTPKAGKTLVTTALKNNLSLTAVTLNDSDIYNTHTDLYEYGFSNYKILSILNRDTFSYRDEHYDGKMYINNSFSYPVRADEEEKVEIVIEIINNQNLNDTDRVGSVIVYLDEEEIHREDLLIKKNSKAKSFFDKVFTWIKNLFK